MFKLTLLTLSLLFLPLTAYGAEGDLQVNQATESSASGQGAGLLQPGSSQLQGSVQPGGINQAGGDNALQSAGTKELLQQYLQSEVDTSLLSASPSADPQASARYFWMLMGIVLAGGSWLAYDYRRHIRI